MKEATSCDTFESRNYYRSAVSAIRKKSYREAEMLLKKALKIAPDNVLYMSYYGLCVGRNGKLDVAEDICRKAVNISPDESMVYVNLGRILLDRGRKGEARQMFLRAYKVDNTSSQAALELSRMGIRRPPVIKFLCRSNPLNIMLGKFRHRLIKFRKPGLKRLQ